MPKARKKSKGENFLRWTAYGLFLFVALTAGSIWGAINSSSLFRTIVIDDIFHKNPKIAFGNKSSVVLLLLGCDEDRYYRGTYLHGSNIIRKYARTDMMLLTKLDFDNGKITGISIPRDTMFALPGYKKHKINAYFSVAPFDKKSSVPVLVQRAALTQKAVEGLLPGVHVDQSVVLNFEAFQSLVDLVGGVDIDVPEKMDYDDKAGELHIHLKPGIQHMNGEQAMGFVRFRHDTESDFGRQERQKDFMLAFKKAVLGNLGKVAQIVEGGKQVFNGSLTDDQIAALYNFSKKVPQTSIQMGMVPVVERRGQIFLDKAKTPAALRTFGFGDS